MELNVNETFASVQGEGIHTGIPTFFVRLAGCDLGCRWCDTPYSRDPGSGEPVEQDLIIDMVENSGCRSVCITGGEPLLQKGAAELCRLLLRRGYQVDLETNGAHDISHVAEMEGPLTISIDVKTPSSGEEESFLMENLHHLRETDQMKFILESRKDLEFTFSFLENNTPSCNIILTPCGNENGKTIVEAVLEALKSGKTSYSLQRVLGRSRVMVQTHKVFWPVDQRGV